MFPHEAEHLLKADKSLLDVGVGVRPLAIRCWDNQIDGQLGCSSHPNFERCHSSGRVHLGVEGESVVRVYVGDASGLQSDSAEGIIANAQLYIGITYQV